MLLGDVQRFIGESRSTAGEIIQELARLATQEVLHPLAGLPVLCGGVNRTLPPPPRQDVEDAWLRWVDGKPRLSRDYYGGS